MKKIFAVLLVFCLMLLTAPLNINAYEGILLSVDNTQPQVGEYITLNVEFNASSNINALFYELKYDDTVLEFSSSSANLYNIVDGKIRYISAGDFKTSAETYTFKCIAPADTDLTVSSVCAADTQEYTYPDVSYSISVERTIPFDVNGDGYVDISDLTALKLYLAGTGMEIDENASDIDGSGTVDIADLSLLKLSLAGI